MCAIFGIFGQYNETLAKESTKILSHRGQSDRVLIRENLYISHRLLAINSTDSSDMQPFLYKNLIIAFNGEIYNYRELNRKFDLNCDSEVGVIAKLFEKFGVDFVNHLIGMFAIAIVEDSKIYLFRDRMGKKPLFYSIQKDSFIFSSEIKAIKPHIKISINNDAILSYFSFLAPLYDLTFFKNIHKLPSSCYLIYENGKVEVKRYFNLLDIKERIYDREVAFKELDRALKESIESRLKSQREIGSLLSGGIDSSLICSIVSKEFGYKLKTFSIGYDGFAKYDERGFAKIVADDIQSEHFEFNFKYNDFFEKLDEILDVLDEPINDSASIPLLFLMQEIDKIDIRVLLSGEGSDELFFGYRQYFEMYDVQKLSNLKFKNWLRGYFKRNFSINREWEWFKRILEDSYLFRSTAENFTDLQKNTLLKQEVLDNSSLKFIKPYIDEFEDSKLDILSWYNFIDLKVLVNDVYLAKVDRVSMANTIEVRNPFLDYRFVQTALSIDSNLKFEQPPKEFLRGFAKKYLPNEIIERKKKGFSYPFLEWLYESKEIYRVLKINQEIEIFNQEKLEQLIEAGKRGKFRQHIFGIYLFCRFMERSYM